MQLRILIIFLCVFPIPVSLAAANLAKPAFSLERIVATRVPGQYVVSPDKKSVVYTHVGRFFGHPLIPDFGEDSNLIHLDLESGRTVRLTSGPETTIYPLFSPNGRYVSFESEGDIWRVEVRTGALKRLTTHVSRDSQAAWSPDGNEIAFVSSRWGRPAIYVMSATGEREDLRQVTPDGFGGRYPIWSPDGKSILFSAARDDVHPYASGIHRVTASGGEPERLTPDDDARNVWPSFSPDGGRIAYVSDRSGFLNIWEMSPAGTNQRQITNVSQDQYYSDSYYIQSVGLRWSPDGDQILYFTNRLGNLDLMTVDVASRRTALISDKDGSHHPVDWIDNRTIAYVYEDYKTPPDLYVKRLDKRGATEQLTHSGHAVYTENAFDKLESVHWTSEDGIEIHGYLRTPSLHSTTSDVTLPALVVSHTYEVGQFYNQWNPIFSYITQSGYVLLTVNHRGSNGYGRKFRDLPRGDYGFGHVKDLASGAEFLGSLPEVDPARVGVLGYSMGGYLTLLAVATRPDSFKVGISVCGFSEITHERGNSDTYFTWHLGGTEAEVPEAYLNASPVSHVSKITAPVQILHGEEDTIEPVTKVRNFIHELDKFNKTYELRTYENEAHGLVQPENQLDAYQRVMNFLETHL